MKIAIAKELQESGGIYIIRCTLTNDRYIGWSGCFLKRYAQHYAQFRRDIRPKLLYAKMRELGAENFEMSLFELNGTRTREFELIRDLKPTLNGVNFNPNHSDEIKLKISLGCKTKVKISQFTLNGEHLKDFESAMQIQRELGLFNNSIIDCCRGRQKTAYKYKWEYTK